MHCALHCHALQDLFTATKPTGLMAVLNAVNRLHSSCEGCHALNIKFKKTNFGKKELCSGTRTSNVPVTSAWPTLLCEETLVVVDRSQT